MRTHSRVYTFRTPETRTGPDALCTPGTTVLTGRHALCGRRLPPHNGEVPIHPGKATQPGMCT